MDRDAERFLAGDDKVVVEVSHKQLQHFTDADSRCRGVQLPEGVMLRYTLSQALYFYLKTCVKEGKITTDVFASDSPYDRQKSAIGEVTTPMFESDADANHLQKLEAMLRSWVDFVNDTVDTSREFRSFPMDHRPR